MNTKLVIAASVLWPAILNANTAPVPLISSVAMRPGTTLMDVVYRVNDPDDATVKVRALAFIDGTRSFAKVIRPVTFVEGTASNLGNAITTNSDHTLTWDVAADWSTDVGQVKFEILALDGRGLLQLDWVAIPSAGGQPAITISKDTPSGANVLDALFWLHADQDPGVSLTNGVLSCTAAAGNFQGAALASGATLMGYAQPFLFRKMNLDPVSLAEVNYAHVTARAGLLNTTAWHAANRPYGGMDCAIGWGATSDLAFPAAGTTDVMAMDLGLAVAAAVRSDGSVFSWGPWSSSMPAGLTGVTAVSAGDDFCVALKSDGTVVGWGNNNYWQATVPSGLTGVTAIAAGGSTALAVKNDGTVVAWGNDQNYRKNIPAGLSGVTSVALGGNFHCLARKSNGTVVAWGVDAGYGLLNVPSGLSGVTAVAAGYVHSLALKSDGTVVAWGDNTYGQSTVPPGLSGVVAIAAGHLHSVALKGDGTVVAWGYNNFGATNVPSGLTGVTAITAGGSYNLALRPHPP